MARMAAPVMMAMLREVLGPPHKMASMPFVRASARSLSEGGHITRSVPPSWPHPTVPGRRR